MSSGLRFELRVVSMAAVIGFLPALCPADGFASLEQALLRLIAMEQAVNDRFVSAGFVGVGYEYDGSGCLSGYLLPEGGENGMIQTFEAGKRYLLLAAGDADVVDLDMWVKTEDQTQTLAEDVLEDATPVIEFQPDRTGRYAVKLRNVDSDGVPSFCCFLVLSETDEPRIGRMRLAEALDNAIALARARGLFAKEIPDGLMLFGGRFEPGAGHSVFDLSYENGSYVAIAAGSNGLADVDLAVTRQFRHGAVEGVMIAEDKLTDARPICEFAVDAGSRYRIEVTNASPKPGFAFGFVLRD